MSAHGWWTTEYGELLYGEPPLCPAAGVIGAETTEPRENLVQCVRDAETLARARELARSINATPPYFHGPSILALLALLTEDGGS